MTSERHKWATDPEVRERVDRRAAEVLEVALAIVTHTAASEWLAHKGTKWIAPGGASALDSDPGLNLVLRTARFADAGELKALEDRVAEAEDARRALAVEAFTAPDADWNVMLDSLRARIRSISAAAFNEPVSTPYRTKSGRELTEADIERLADEAESGYDADQIRARSAEEHYRGEPVGRLDPDDLQRLRDADTAAGHRIDPQVLEDDAKGVHERLEAMGPQALAPGPLAYELSNLAAVVRYLAREVAANRRLEVRLDETPLIEGRREARQRAEALADFARALYSDPLDTPGWDDAALAAERRAVALGAFGDKEVRQTDEPEPHHRPPDRLPDWAPDLERYTAAFPGRSPLDPGAANDPRDDALDLIVEQLAGWEGYIDEEDREEWSERITAIASVLGLTAPRGDG